MDKMKILLDLNSIELDILASAYISDYDGDDEEGKQIIRQVFVGINEECTRNILKKIGEIIQEIKESE